MFNDIQMYTLWIQLRCVAGSLLRVEKDSASQTCHWYSLLPTHYSLFVDEFDRPLKTRWFGFISTKWPTTVSLR